MRSTYDSSERERSRQRGREGQYSLTRDLSPDDPYNRGYSTHQFAIKKRVKFNDEEDIRVFRKQDEPIAKSLSEEEILLVKKQIEKQVSRIYDFNWDQKKHFDALSEQNSMKEQKQKEKQLFDKLMGMKEETDFYAPYALALPINTGIPVAGSESIEKQAHTERTRDVLGCYYTQINQIPNEPIFEVSTQCNKNQPKVIFFNPGGMNEGAEFVKSSKFEINKDKKNEKQLKGILKIPGEKQSVSAPKQSVEREISPRLLWLLKDMQVNTLKYNNEMTDLLLKPYKESGELDYWMKNRQALNQKLKNQPVGGPAPPSNIPVITNPPPIQPIQPYRPSPMRMSPSPGHQFRPQYQPYDPIQQKAQKYKTVPCKYFHGPQGCVKTENCTFIHDQQYRGVPHPLMLRQQYPPYNNSYENRGGFQSQNPNFQRKQHYQSFGGYPGGGHYQNKPFHHGYHKKFDHYQSQPGQYQPGSYPPQQPRPYQSYGQQGQMGQSNYQPMGQSIGQPLGQQMGQQMGQPGTQQQPMQGYQNYPGMQQGQQQKYYDQGQMRGMQSRNPNQN